MTLRFFISCLFIIGPTSWANAPEGKDWQAVAQARSLWAKASRKPHWSSHRIGSSERVQNEVQQIIEALKVGEPATRRILTWAAVRSGHPEFKGNDAQWLSVKKWAEVFPSVHNFIAFRNRLQHQWFDLLLWSEDYSPQTLNSIHDRAIFLHKWIIENVYFYQPENSTYKGPKWMHQDGIEFLSPLIDNSKAAQEVRKLAAEVHRELNAFENQELALAQQSVNSSENEVQMGSAVPMPNQADRVTPTPDQIEFPLLPGWLQTGDPWVYVPGGQMSGSCQGTLSANKISKN